VSLPRAAGLAAIGRTVAWIADVVFPRDCVGCGTPLRPASRGEFCAGCLASLPWMPEPVCAVCGEGFKVPSPGDADRFAGRVCVRCREDPPPFIRARAAFAYQGAIRHAVQALKFRGRRAAGGALGRLMVEGLDRAGEIPQGIAMIAPVPLHRSRLRQRGYNQAALVAEPLAAALGLPLEEDVLVRERPTPPQVGLDRRERVLNLAGAFAVTAPGRVGGKRVLVVDDVLTTGATVSACAGALVKAGAQEVRVAAVARG